MSLDVFKFMQVNIGFLDFCFKLYLGYFFRGKVDNVAPRKQSEQFAAISPLLARRLAENNMIEGFLIWAPAVLIALQAPWNLIGAPCRADR